MLEKVKDFYCLYIEMVDYTLIYSFLTTHFRFSYNYNFIQTCFFE